ncbi:MAG: MarC family protein [Candidatus Micrarchaeota archaeon]|nr:MarC family protein [Candidatus Micrarchaeota archaeon]
MEPVVRAFVALFFVMQPFASINAFLSLTKNMHSRDRANAANKAVLAAALTLIIFTIIGPFILEILGVSLESFQIAGGIMLFLISLQFVLGLNVQKETPGKIDVAVVLIGVPLITGPGAMTAAILLSKTEGLNAVIWGAVLASLATFIVLRYAERIHRFIGPQGEEIMTRLMGLLLGSIAMEFIRKGFGM